MTRRCEAVINARAGPTKYYNFVYSCFPYFCHLAMILFNITICNTSEQFFLTASA